MLVAPDSLMISGTASIVGHASQHADSVAAQVDEIFVNLGRLLQSAHMRSTGHCRRPLASGSLIKVYLRNRVDLQTVEESCERFCRMVFLGWSCRATCAAPICWWSSTALHAAV